MSLPASFDRPQSLVCADGALFGAGNARLRAPPMSMFGRNARMEANGGASGKRLLVAERVGLFQSTQGF